MPYVMCIRKTKKMYFFPSWSFIGLFRSVHWSKVDYWFVFEVPISRSLNHEKCFIVV